MRLLETIVPFLEHNKKEAFLFGVASFAAVAVADYITPEAVTFSIFYLIPITVFLWFIGSRAAWFMAFASVLVWPGDHIMMGDFSYFRSFFPYWEGAVRLGFYAIFIFSLVNIRDSISSLKSVNAALTEALGEVRRVRGLIPICSSCKKIRNESQEWVVLEKYIQDRSDAKFSHGLCPECMKTLYPDYPGPKSKEGKT